MENFSGKAGELVLRLISSSEEGDMWVVSADRNGDRSIDFNFGVVTTHGLDLNDQSNWIL